MLLPVFLFYNFAINLSSPPCAILNIYPSTMPILLLRGEKNFTTKIKYHEG